MKRFVILILAMVLSSTCFANARFFRDVKELNNEGSIFVSLFNSFREAIDGLTGLDDQEIRRIGGKRLRKILPLYTQQFDQIIETKINFSKLVAKADTLSTDQVESFARKLKETADRLLALDRQYDDLFSKANATNIQQKVDRIAAAKVGFVDRLRYTYMSVFTNADTLRQYRLTIVNELRDLIDADKKASDAINRLEVRLDKL